VEKRRSPQEIPIWDPDICIDCGKCAIVCPHAAIRMKVFDPAEALAGRAGGLPVQAVPLRELDGHLLTVQVAPDDCTGCGVCVDVCPARARRRSKHKAINMRPARAPRRRARPNWDFFLEPARDRPRRARRHDTVKGSQLLQPLFEFSGACAGCGETPYLKLLTQLFGDRMVVANATGCSSIYGGNLPTTPWSVDADGRGPAWSNSLFEDNAEFGLGMRLGDDAQPAQARRAAGRAGPAPWLGADWRCCSSAEQADEAGGRAQRERRRAARGLAERLMGDERRAAPLLATRGRRRSCAAACGSSAATAGPTTSASAGSTTCSPRADVNVLVLDTEVYSNTGGQASKATPRATAKFAAAARRRQEGPRA
jgi:pyruvate-ferredoxin/flavodoxin oxidoreductase